MDRMTLVNTEYGNQKEKYRQKEIEHLKQKYPNMGKKQWVEKKEQVDRLIKLHKIDSFFLNNIRIY